MKPRARCCTCNHQHDDEDDEDDDDDDDDGDDDGDHDVDDHSSSVGAWLTCEVRPVPSVAKDRKLSHTHAARPLASRDGFSDSQMDYLLLEVV